MGSERPQRAFLLPPGHDARSLTKDLDGGSVIVILTIDPAKVIHAGAGAALFAEQAAALREIASEMGSKGVQGEPS